MARPLKRLASLPLIAWLLLSRAAVATSPNLAINSSEIDFESSGHTPNPDLNTDNSEKRMWVVAIRSWGPNELAQAVTGAKANCPGKPVTLHANITPAAGRIIQYAWTLNGQSQGGNTPEFTFTPNNTGTFNVQVTISDVTPPPPPMQ